VLQINNAAATTGGDDSHSAGTGTARTGSPKKKSINHFTRMGLLMPTPAGVVEKGSKYILAHNGLRVLDGRPHGEVWVGVVSRA